MSGIRTRQLSQFLSGVWPLFVFGMLTIAMSVAIANDYNDNGANPDNTAENADPNPMQNGGAQPPNAAPVNVPPGNAQPPNGLPPDQVRAPAEAPPADQDPYQNQNQQPPQQQQSPDANNQ